MGSGGRAIRHSKSDYPGNEAPRARINRSAPMSDESKPDTGLLGRAKGLADRVGDYARSDDARAKLDSLKKRAAQAGEVAAAGAKKVAKGTRQAAAQAREKADEFSKSERGEAMKAKAKGGWDEIRGGTFRGLKVSNSPLVIALAIFLFFPLGLFLLWRHPVLAPSKKWWLTGCAWGLIAGLAFIGFVQERMGVDAKGPRSTPDSPSATASPEELRLEADYLPHIPGAVREYDNQVSIPGGMLMRLRRREIDGADGRIEVSNSLIGGTLDGRDSGVRQTKLDKPPEERHRIADGFVEIGKRSEFDPNHPIVWERVLKLDARKGDVWEQDLSETSRLKTTLVEFATLDGKPSAVIDRIFTMDRTDSSPAVIAHQERKYVKGIGLVEEAVRSKMGDEPERTTSMKKLISSEPLGGGKKPATSIVAQRRQLLIEAESLWDAGDSEGAAKVYHAFRKTWGDQKPRFFDGEKEVYGDHLTHYYVRMIDRSVSLFRNNYNRYAGMIKVAQEHLDNASQNGVVLPSAIARKVREAQDAPVEEKSFKVGKGFGRGSLVIELPTDHDAGVVLKDPELTAEGSLEFTLTWFPERSDEPARRWAAYDVKGVSLVNGVIVYGRSIRGGEPTRAHMLLGPDLWKKVATIKVE